MFGHKAEKAALRQTIEELQRQLADREQQLETLTSREQGSKKTINHLLQQFAHKTAAIAHFAKLGSSLDLIREKSAQNAESMDNEQSKLRETSSLFQQSTMVLAQISSGIETLNETTSASVTKVKELDEATRNIEQFTKVISDISNQTNLLALNAAIEAARAGEEGRGFAVVADEVRLLASKTAATTNQINELVQTINQLSAATQTSFEKIVVSSSAMGTSLQTVETVIEEVVSLANDMTRVISTSTSNAFISAVKLDHAVFKADIYQHIFGMSKRSADSFADHHQCRMGQWYYAGQGQQLAALTSFQRLEEPHRQVHQYAVDAMQQRQANRFDKCIEALYNMEQASLRVIVVLDQLSDEFADLSLSRAASSAQRSNTDDGDVDLF